MGSAPDLNQWAAHSMSVEEVDQWAAPFVTAIGEAVIASAALEKVLLAVMGTLQLHDQGAYAAALRALSGLERAPAGRLLKDLRRLGLPEETALRIEDVIGRRNDLVHRPLERFGALEALRSGESIDAAVRRVTAIAEDCDKLSHELLRWAYPVIEQVTGRPVEDSIAVLMALDLDQLEDDDVKEELRMARHHMSILGWQSP